jgi:transposase
MRFIQGLSNKTIKLLQKIYKQSKHHQVRHRAQCVLLSYQGYTTNELAHIFRVDRITIAREHFDMEVSKQTIKRVLKSLLFSWRRIRKKVKGEPDPLIYQERKEALEQLIEEDRQGIIDLRYFDESGFCLVPYVPYAWQEHGETIAIASGHSQRLNI